MQLNVFKYEGAGNDFVVVDDRGRAFPADTGRAVRALCDRRRGVGADGVLLLRPPDVTGTDFSMAYFNADGGEAEMCGNGARCLASFAHMLGVAKPEMAFNTAAGVYQASVLADGRVSVRFPDIGSLPASMKLEIDSREWDCDFLVAGVPHLVLWVPDVASIDLPGIGKTLRFHTRFSPTGTNVNFAQRVESTVPTVRIRTYERGVEGETLACGTGSVAVACCLGFRSKLASGPVRIYPTSGDLLEIEFEVGARFEKVALIGPARRVFSGVIEIPG